MCVLLLAGSALYGEYSDPGPVGLGSMEQFRMLPYLWYGVRAAGESSHDRTGGNVDRNNYLYTEGSDYIILDVMSPGCIYRIWTTGQNNDEYVRFYLDNETTPRINVRWRDMYAGNVPPFLSPLVGNDTVSSGGFFSYLPVQFKQRCKIAIRPSDPSRWFYYNILYHTFADANAVNTYTGSENSAGVRALWNTTGNPSSNPDTTVVANSSSVGAGASIVMADVAGPGVVNSFLLRIPSVIPGDAMSDAVLRDVWLRVFWDGSPFPAVEAPIGEFFACGLGEYTVNGLPIRMATGSADWYQCYFPMPFGSRARFELTNKGSTSVPNVDWEVHVGAMPDAAQLLREGRLGYFRATHRFEWPTRLDEDYTILNTTGRGVFVGCVLTMSSTGSQEYLEGDERIYVDGSLSPSIYGTGTEDFFNGGWYFNKGTFTRQVHGNPASETTSSYNRSCYRFFLGDKIPYYSSLKVGIEHGSTNNVTGNYSSIAYYYQADQPGIVKTDEIDIGDPTSESAHSYARGTQVWSGLLNQQYEGDSDAYISDDGRQLNGYCEFTVRIHPSNYGVRLRRRMNYSLANQKGTVYVDGTKVGYWYDAGSATNRWRDSEYELPASVTAGKSSLRIRIEGSTWNEFRYQVFTYPHVAAGSTIADVKNNPDGDFVILSSKVVTAGTDQLAGTFYIEDKDRSSGIKVYDPSCLNAVSEGDLVTVFGKLDTSLTERMISDPTVISRTPVIPLVPLSMGCAAVGGESLNNYTPGIPGRNGVHNTGLLVTVWGRVTYSDTLSRVFYVDDGSQLSDGSGRVGLQVNCASLAPGNTIVLPPRGSFVKVTGISSRKTINGRPVPVLRPRKQSDVEVLPAQ